MRPLILKKPELADSLLIFLLIFTPLALGTVHRWSIIAFSLVAVLIFNLYLFKSDVKLGDLFKPAIAKWCIVFLAVALVQLIPLPGGILKSLSPATYALYKDYLLTYTDSTFRPLSIYPWVSIQELLKFIAYGFIFLFVYGRTTQRESPRREPSLPSGHELNYLQLGCLTALLTILIHSFVDFNLHITANAFYFVVILALSTCFRSLKDTVLNKKFLLKVVNSMIIVGFLVAVFAIIYKFSGPRGKVYWVIEKSGGIFGPYINYDHYAGFMGMCASLSIALFIGHIRASSFFNLRGLRNKILWFSTHEANKTLLYLFVSVIMTASLFLSSSRGGILSFSIAAILMFSLAIIRIKTERRKRIFLAVILIMCIAAVMIVWVGPEQWTARFFKLNKLISVIIKEGPLSQDIRISMWRDTSQIIKDFPFTGSGLGTFSKVYPKYRTLELYYGFLRYAHSDYLQLITEIGIAGWVAVILLWSFFIVNYVRVIKRLT